MAELHLLSDGDEFLCVPIQRIPVVGDTVRLTEGTFGVAQVEFDYRERGLYALPIVRVQITPIKVD